jgi:hypothetical protein
MNLPSFTAEASLYKTANRYRGSAGSFASDGNVVAAQDCGFTTGLVCGTFITGGVVVCTASCLASPALGGIPCLVCWTGFLGGLYGFCRDCIPAWMRALLDLAESGGGSNGGGGSGGGGGGGVPKGQCGCPAGQRCCGNCIKVPGQGLQCDGDCTPKAMACE